MAFLKKAAAKFLAMFKQNSANDHFRDDFVKRARANAAGGDPHNGFGTGIRGPKNDWGMNGRSGW
ncbi:hypothetical protein POK33_38490 [Burkholderia cenocepacia]|uniref:hypothetical protein n=1 Tax=Burkholderia cenocepacia TaxID=95486 RepID=UPI0023B9A973|nr:hypothetical protein [Burkholderia cenocepacia]MDF0506645.1 hypothetical protein [Burkholderia cenocepacia]